MRLGLGIGLSYPRSGGGTPAPAPTAQRFGALTQAGYGGVPVTGTAISSGDPLNHWQISGGFLTPSSAGDTADLNAGPYSLVLNDGTAHTVTIDANSYDVRSQSEWLVTAALGAVALDLKTIYIRPGASFDPQIIDTVGMPLRRAQIANRLTIESRDYTQKATFTTQAVCTFRNVTFKGIVWGALKTNNIALSCSATNPTFGIKWLDCEFYGRTIDPTTAFTNGYSTTDGANTFSENTRILVTGTAGYAYDFELQRCVFKYCRRGFTLPSQGGLTVKGCLVDAYYDVGFQVFHPPATFETTAPTVTMYDNVIARPTAVSTYPSNPHPDAIIYSGRSDATVGVTIDWQRNIAYTGNATGHLGGYFVRDFVGPGGSPNSGQYADGQILASALIGCRVEGISIQSARNFKVKGCTAVGRAVDADDTILIQVGAGSDSSTSGTHVITNNIAEAYNVGGSPTSTDNVTLGLTGLTAAYAAIFDGGADWVPDTLAEVKAFFNRKTGSAADLPGAYDAGAFGSGVATWATTVPGSNGMTNIS